jgi:hypothetical protein
LRWAGVELAIAAATVAAAFGVTVGRVATERPERMERGHRDMVQAWGGDPKLGPPRPPLPEPCFELDDRDLDADYGERGFSVAAQPWSDAHDHDVQGRATEV